LFAASSPTLNNCVNGTGELTETMVLNHFVTYYCEGINNINNLEVICQTIPPIPTTYDLVEFTLPPSPTGCLCDTRENSESFSITKIFYMISMMTLLD